MTRQAARRLAGRPAVSEDYTSLVERMVYLHGLRAAFACVTLGFAVQGSALDDGALVRVGLATAGYLALALAAEGLRRGSARRGLWAIGAMLFVDGLYLAWVIYLTGGTDSPLRFLVYLHIVGVTLLASHRTGLKLAVWHTLLFLSALFAQAAGILVVTEESSAALPGLGGDFAHRAATNLAAMWGVAVGTAVFSSVIERELRGQKADLQTLAAMVAELDRRLNGPDVARVLLERLIEAFGFTRGAVLASPEHDLTVLALHGEVRVAEPAPGREALVERAWTDRAPVLAGKLDPATNPGLSALLPSARNLLIVPLLAEGHPLGVAVLEYPRARIRRWIVAMAQQFASHGALALRNAWLLQDVQRMAETDPLTGVANRRAFDEALRRELARASRTGQQVSLLMLDVDRFKDFNDRYGHPAGDRLLRSIAQALVGRSRSFDVVARYGGEEFAVILPECSDAECSAAAERLRRVTEALDSPAKVTMSGGTATFPLHTDEAEQLVEMADAALYESKRAGRDRLSRAVTGRRLASSGS